MIHRTFAPLALALVAIALALALGATPAAAAQINFTVDLDGAQATPPTVSAGSGTAAVSLDNVSNLLTWELKFSGLTNGPQSAIAAHFHLGAPGVGPGPIEIDIENAAFKSPHVGSATITDLQKADLIAGLWYINVHTGGDGGFPGGEIRGQVLQGGGGVGGVAELPEAAGTPLDATGSSDGNAGLLAGVIAAVVAGAVALGGAVWYVRRRPA